MKTTITLEKETATNLNLMKYAMGLETLDSVILKLILCYKKQEGESNKQNDN